MYSLVDQARKAPERPSVHLGSVCVLILYSKTIRGGWVKKQVRFYRRVRGSRVVLKAYITVDRHKHLCSDC